MFQVDYGMKKQHFFTRYFFHFCSISFFNFVLRMPGAVTSLPIYLNALASNESDELVWQVGLHHVRRAAAAVHYMELQ